MGAAEPGSAVGEGQPGYDRRSDGNADHVVNVGDVTVLFGGGVMLTSCTPP